MRAEELFPLLASAPTQRRGAGCALVERAKRAN
jgi:hypothetical protein